MLGAMLRPTFGFFTVDGVDLASPRERALPPLRARHFGFVFQDFNLFSALNVVENVELACNPAGVSGRAAMERATELLRRLGLGECLRFRPDQLSGGEKQRVAVARALANDPAGILADEGALQDKPELTVRKVGVEQNLFNRASAVGHGAFDRPRGHPPVFPAGRVPGGRLGWTHRRKMRRRADGGPRTASGETGRLEEGPIRPPLRPVLGRHGVD